MPSEDINVGSHSEPIHLKYMVHEQRSIRIVNLGDLVSYVRINMHLYELNANEHVDLTIPSGQNSITLGPDVFLCLRSQE